MQYLNVNSAPLTTSTDFFHLRNKFDIAQCKLLSCKETYSIRLPKTILLFKRFHAVNFIAIGEILSFTFVGLFYSNITSYGVVFKWFVI